MFKNKGNLEKAIDELAKDNNNAVAHVYKEAKINEGTLSGVTVTLKDAYATKDAATQASSMILKGFQPGYDATVVEKLNDAGASIVAKTHMDELALGGTGTFSAFGVIKNPLDETRLVGGSSSGSAATMTKNIGLAIGSDTGDSVRLPASYVGVVGFKPSYGAVSRYGLFSFASSLDTVSWFTHNVSDSIVASQILFGRDDKDMTSLEVEKPSEEVIKPKKVAFLEDYGVLPKSISDKYADLKKQMLSDGIEVEIVSIDEKLLKAIGIVYEVISFSEASSNDANLTGISFGNAKNGSDWNELLIKTRTAGFGSMVQRRFTLGAFFLSVENQDKYFNKAREVRTLIVEAFNKIYNEFDIVVFPSSSAAPLVSEGKPNNWWSDFLTHSNFTGNPSISIPWTTEDGMPVGLNINAKIYNDKKLLSNVLYIEKMIGGSDE